MRPGEEDVVESLRLELPEQGSGVEVRIYECFRDESHGVEPEADSEQLGIFESLELRAAMLALITCLAWSTPGAMDFADSSYPNSASWIAVFKSVLWCLGCMALGLWVWSCWLADSPPFVICDRRDGYSESGEPQQKQEARIYNVHLKCITAWTRPDSKRT